MSRSVCTWLAVASIFAAACESEVPTGTRRDPNQLLAGFTPIANAALRPPPASDGSGDAILALAMKMPGVRRSIPVRSAEPSLELASAGLDPGALTRANGNVVGLVTPQGHYLLELDKSIGPPLAGRRAEPGSIVERGWSNAADSRTRITGTSIPIEIGQLAMSFGTCSGALIGRRIVRTAAHCVIQHTPSGGSVAGSITFRQRRDESTYRAIDTTSSIIYGGAYIPTGCGRSTADSYAAGYAANLDACNWADWAYLILSTDWYSEAGSTSWYGFGGLSTGSLGLDLTSYGYPGCDDGVDGGVNQENGILHDPAGCRTHPGAAYVGNSARCEVGGWLSATARFTAGCDTSPGNSGGPVLQRGTSILIGHSQTEDCGTCSFTNNYPDHYLGHDDFLFNLQLQLRQTYP